MTNSERAINIIDTVQAEVRKLFAERDALRSEVERLKNEIDSRDNTIAMQDGYLQRAEHELIKLKAERDKDIAAAVEAAKLKMWEDAFKVMCPKYGAE